MHLVYWASAGEEELFATLLFAPVRPFSTSANRLNPLAEEMVEVAKPVEVGVCQANPPTPDRPQGGGYNLDLRALARSGFGEAADTAASTTIERRSQTAATVLLAFGG